MFVRSFVHSFVRSFAYSLPCSLVALLSLWCLLCSPFACASSNANDTGRLKLVKSHKRSHHTSPPKMRPLAGSLFLSLCVAAAYSRHALCSLTYKNTATTTTTAEAAKATATLHHGKCCCCCVKCCLLIVSVRLLRTQQSYQHTHDKHTQHTHAYTAPSAAAASAVVVYLILLWLCAVLHGRRRQRQRRRRRQRRVGASDPWRALSTPKTIAKAQGSI